MVSRLLPALLAVVVMQGRGADLDLTRAAVVVGADASRMERKAAAVLTEEVGKRSWAEWRIAAAMAASVVSSSKS